LSVVATDGPPAQANCSLGFQLLAAVAITALVGELFAERIWPFTSKAATWYGEVLCRHERLAHHTEPNQATIKQPLSAPWPAAR